MSTAQKPIGARRGPLGRLFRWGARTALALGLGPPYALGAAASYLWLRSAGPRRIPARAPAEDSPLIVMLVCSNLPVDPRVEREARALAAHGFRVKVICPQWWPWTRPPDWGRGVSFNILARRTYRFSTFFPYVFSPALLWAALAEQAWAYHAHDLDTVLMALTAAAVRRVPCLCDFHEWYSQNVTFDRSLGVYRPHRWYKRWLFRTVERLALRCATRVITVCDSIGKALEELAPSPRNVAVIRNIPPLSSPEPGQQPDLNLRAHPGIPGERLVVLYQGGVGPSRNLEPVIRAMAHVPNAALVIRGPSIEEYSADYLELAFVVGAGNRVFCLPPVPSAEVVAEARAADVGLYTVVDVGLNFRFALPNKVFEYLAAGLPLLCADLPEVRRLVDRYGVGVCFDPDDPASIAAAINRLVGDADFRRACRNNIPAALDDLRADREWNKFAELYLQVAETGSAGRKAG